MVSKQDIVEAFDDLGYTLENQEVIEKLHLFCTEYGLDEAQISKEYLNFAKTKQPDLDILNRFQLKLIEKNKPAEFHEKNDVNPGATPEKSSFLQKPGQKQKKIVDFFQNPIISRGRHVQTLQPCERKFIGFTIYKVCCKKNQ